MIWVLVLTNSIKYYQIYEVSTIYFTWIVFAVWLTGQLFFNFLVMPKKHFRNISHFCRLKPPLISNDL